MLKSVDQLDKTVTAIHDLVSGLNCSVIIKKGLGSFLATTCSFDPNNFSMLSSLLDISFYQLLVTYLAMFGVCFGCCYDRYSMTYRKIGVDEEKDNKD